MKRGSLASRIERLEQQRNPDPGLIIVCLRDGESEEAARARAIVECGVKPNYRGFVFCNELDASS